mgnify:CR=1 FL=1
MKKTAIGLCLLMMAMPVSAQNSNFTETDCPFPEYIYEFTCGFATVPENHLVDNGETIQLAVAVIHSLNPQPQPDPVMYLAGGPGGAFVSTAEQMPLSYNLNSLLINRDVIIVDQRGMGLSQPNLRCVPFTNVNDAFNLSIEEYQERMRDCIPEFEAQGIDWQAYTTEQNAADLALVPLALGYEEYNIFGQSYGTLLGQIMLRDHDEHIRSAVLDSVLSINTNSFEEAALNSAALFEQIEADCDADFLCGSAYGDLSDLYMETYTRLQENPVILNVDGIEFPVDGRMFADFVHINMANRGAISKLPALITAFAEDDFEIVIQFVEGINERSVEDYPNQALLMTMVCPHNAPYTTPEQIIEVHSTVPEPFRAASFNESTWMLCQSWDGVPPASQELADSDVPTLLLGGSYDVLTPPQGAYDAAENLTNATVVEIPYVGHLTNSNGCAIRMIATFFDDPDAPVDSSCTEDIKPVAFVLHTTVTRPPIRVGAIILGLIGLFGVGQMLFVGLRDIRRTAWVIAFKKQGWMPLISLVVLLLLVWMNSSILPSDFVTVGVVQSIVPLLMAIQASLVFSPGDEPALEVQMAASRSTLWIVVERLLVVILTYSVIALIGIGLTLIIEPDQNMPVLLIGWLPPALFLSGLATYMTIRSRMVAMGALTIGFLWFIFGLFAPYFIPGQSYPYPVGIIQPYMWSIHVHASLEDLTLADFWLNRAFLTGAGLSMMLAAVYELRDTEKLLLGVRSKSRTTAKKVDQTVPQHLKPSVTVEAVPTRIVPWHQIMGMTRYTFLMRMRSRGIKVYALTPLAVFGIFIFAMGDLSFIPGYDSASAMPPEQYYLVVGEMMAAFSAAFFFLLSTGMYPILVADTVPSDNRLKVDEMLNSLPIAYWIQLTGRVLGTIAAGALVITVIMILTLIASLWRFGYFSVMPYMDLIVTMVIAQSLMTALAVLLGSTQKSGRLAIGLVIVLTLVPEFLQQIDLIAFLFPTRVNFFLEYFEFTTFFNPGAAYEWTLFRPEITNYLFAVLLQTIVVAGIAWAWHSYRQLSE